MVDTVTVPVCVFVFCEYLSFMLMTLSWSIDTFCSAWPICSTLFFFFFFGAEYTYTVYDVYVIGLDGTGHKTAG